MTPLEQDIRRRIASAGPLPVRQFMALCLSHPEHGYYTTRDPLGSAGDFITAPEVSQMFGELIGLWAAAVWQQMGEPDNVRLVELGPGRGTMMADALRAARALPAFHAAIVAHLVEVSPRLRAKQEQALAHAGVPVIWHDRLDEVPGGPLILLANEFVDALPVSQAIQTSRGWYERTVEIDDDDKLAFGIAAEPLPLFEQLVPPDLRHARPGTIYEWRMDNLALEIGQRIYHERSAGLIIDYGYADFGIGETLQAVRAHEYVSPLESPGQVDITAHVDFAALIRAIESMGPQTQGPVTQTEFLTSLGIAQRAQALRTAAPHKTDEIDAAVERLVRGGRTGMGSLFKVLGFCHPDIGPLPGLRGEA